MNQTNAIAFKRTTLWISMLCLVGAMSCNRSCERPIEPITEEQPAKENAFVQTEQRPVSYYEDRIKQEWDRIRTDARVEWNKFSEEEFATIEADYHKLVAKIEQKYNVGKEEAERMIRSFLDKH